MSDVQAAQGVRRRVEATGGPLQMPARQLRDAFGRQRLTQKARHEIDGALLSEGLATRPSILEADADELVTIYAAERRAAAVPAAARPRRGTFWGEYRRMPAWLQLLVPVIAVIVIASVASGGSSTRSPDQHAQPARIATNPSGGRTGSGAEARRELRAERHRAAAARRQAERRRERRRREQRQLDQ